MCFLYVPMSFCSVATVRVGVQTAVFFNTIVCLAFMTYSCSYLMTDAHMNTETVRHLHLAPEYLTTSNASIDVEFHRQAVALHTIMLAWNSLGLIAGIVLFCALCATDDRQRKWLLPWITWSVVNTCYTLVNGCVELALWATFPGHISTSMVTLLHYLSIPLQVYFAQLVISFYAYGDEHAMSRPKLGNKTLSHTRSAESTHASLMTANVCGCVDICRPSHHIALPSVDGIAV